MRLLSNLPKMIYVSGKHLAQRVVSLKKLTINQAESFLKSNSELKIYKIVLTQNINFGTLRELICLIYLWKIEKKL